jgi:Carboxypeptidase regulatory-like domain
VSALRFQFSSARKTVLVPAGPPSTAFVTDDLGQFRIYGLAPGSYIVSAKRPDGAASIAGSPAGLLGTTDAASESPTYYPGTADPAEATTVNVGPAQEVAVYFSLVASQSTSLSGSVQDSLGRPVPYAKLQLRSLQVGGDANRSLGQTEGDGTFHLRGVPPGTHTLQARAIDTKPGGDAEFGSTTISATGGAIEGILITTTTGLTISGRVRYEGTSARPPKSSTVRVLTIPTDRGAAVIPMPTDPANGLADELGRFQIRGLGGSVLFRTSAVRGWFLKKVLLNGIDVTDIPLEASRAGGTGAIDVILTDQQTHISGSVTSAHGEPATQYTLVIVPAALPSEADPARWTRSIRPDQYGRFEAVGLPAGSLFVAAVESLQQGEEWAPALQQLIKDRGTKIALTDGQALTLTLELLR